MKQVKYDISEQDALTLTAKQIEEKYGCSSRTARRAKAKVKDITPEPEYDGVVELTEQETQNVPVDYIVTQSKITLIECSNITGIRKDTQPELYKQVLDSILNNEPLNRFITNARVSDMFKANKITVNRDSIEHKGQIIKGMLAELCFNIAIGLEPNDLRIVEFIRKVVENPFPDNTQRLYDFCKNTGIEIDASGDLLAYKKVRHDFKDIYTGTMDNSPGSWVEVDIEEVEKDEQITCAKGLHACSKEYLGCYGSGNNGDDKIVRVKINPRDVVSIPVDYNGAKIRVCRYFVVEEVDL